MHICFQDIKQPIVFEIMDRRIMGQNYSGTESKGGCRKIDFTDTSDMWLDQRIIGI